MTSKILPLVCASALVGVLSGSARAETAQERQDFIEATSIEGRLNQKLTLDFDSEKLETALGMIGAIAKINIILDPKVRAAEPVVTLKVEKMDAATVLSWVAKLTDTHIEYIDKAFYVTNSKPKGKAEAERNELAIELTLAGADTSVLPAEGQEITDQDLQKVAQAIIDKTEPKLQDFPGPHVDLTPPTPGAINPFVTAPGN